MHTLDLDALNREFELADPKSILRWSVETFGERLAIVTSFQPSGIVTLHMLEQLGARPDVLTVDTGLLFPETYALIEEVTRRFDLRLKRITPRIEPLTASGSRPAVNRCGHQTPICAVNCARFSRCMRRLLRIVRGLPACGVTKKTARRLPSSRKSTGA